MSDNNFEELVKARDRLIAKFKRRPKRKPAISPEERQAQLATAVARLEDATRAKQEAMQRSGSDEAAKSIRRAPGLMLQ